MRGKKERPIPLGAFTNSCRISLEGQTKGTHGEGRKNGEE
jgi:hypothetical protein